MSDERMFSRQVDRNLRGIELEKLGETERAVALYEENVTEGFEGNGPYDRLRIIYGKQKRYEEAIRVLERAIFVFENNVSRLRGDRLPKLEKFKSQLEEAKRKIE